MTEKTSYEACLRNRTGIIESVYGDERIRRHTVGGNNSAHVLQYCLPVLGNWDCTCMRATCMDGGLLPPVPAANHEGLCP